MTLFIKQLDGATRINLESLDFQGLLCTGSKRCNDCKLRSSLEVKSVCPIDANGQSSSATCDESVLLTFANWPAFRKQTEPLLANVSSLEEAYLVTLAALSELKDE